jgi:hypothetical protein
MFSVWDVHRPGNMVFTRLNFEEKQQIIMRENPVIQTLRLSSAPFT